MNNMRETNLDIGVRPPSDCINNTLLFCTKAITSYNKATKNTNMKYKALHRKYVYIKRLLLIQCQWFCNEIV